MVAAFPAARALGVDEMKRRLLAGGSALMALVMLGAGPAAAQRARSVPAASAGTLFPVKAVPAEGRILFTLPAPDKDGIAGRYLYANALRTGLGSADLRLDRGMVGDEQILAFRRIGKKIAVTFENLKFRATGDEGVQKGGRDSFPFSTVAMLDIVSMGADGAKTRHGGHLALSSRVAT